MAKICSTESIIGKQPKCLNIFENDDWIIPTNIWNNIISSVKSIEDIPDYLNTYKLSCKNEYISQKQYLFSIVLYLLKNNLDWKFIDRCRDESQHNIYDKIKEIINHEKTNVISDTSEI